MWKTEAKKIVNEHKIIMILLMYYSIARFTSLLMKDIASKLRLHSVMDLNTVIIVIEILILACILIIYTKIHMDDEGRKYSEAKKIQGILLIILVNAWLFGLLLVTIAKPTMWKYDLKTCAMELLIIVSWYLMAYIVKLMGVKYEIKRVLNILMTVIGLLIIYAMASIMIETYKAEFMVCIAVMVCLLVTNNIKTKKINEIYLLGTLSFIYVAIVIIIADEIIKYLLVPKVISDKNESNGDYGLENKEK